MAGAAVLPARPAEERPAGATQCTRDGEAQRVREAIQQATACRNRQLREGMAAACAPYEAPACAGTLVEDAVALAYGAAEPLVRGATRESRAQLRCQRRIGKAVARYVGEMLELRIGGATEADAEARAQRSLERLAERCRVPARADASGAVLPAVGPQCAAAVPAPGGAAVDANALRRCLRTLLRAWVERVAPDPQPLRPNFVVILTDDQRFDATDATHGPLGAAVMPRTRAALAGRGIEFTQAFVTTPQCCPSRASLLTGQYAHRTGVYRNSGQNGGANDFADAETLAVWLAAAGYRTSLVGKYLNGYAALWDPAHEPPYVPPGWTDWYGMRRAQFYDYELVEPDGAGGHRVVSYGSAAADYSTDVLRDKAKAFVSSAVASGQPFFLLLAFNAPHVPAIPAPRHAGRLRALPAWRPPSFDEADVTDKPRWLATTPRLTPAERDELDLFRIAQLEMLQAVDEAIAGSPEHGVVGLLEHLRAVGVEDDTVVVFLSDNGWLWGEHRLRAKRVPYEEAIRTPLFVRYPRLAPLPRTETRLALHLDLAPTFAELAGASAPIPQDGASLVRALDGTAPTWRSDFLAEAWPPEHPWAAVRGERWKYVELPVTPGDPNTAFERELYDLASDPHELTSLHADPQQAPLIAVLAARLRELRPHWPLDSDADGADPEEE